FVDIEHDRRSLRDLCAAFEVGFCTMDDARKVCVVLARRDITIDSLLRLVNARAYALARAPWDKGCDRQQKSRKTCSGRSRHDAGSVRQNACALIAARVLAALRST